ncbi:MAG: DUF58 domain-containing protein [Planctomycetaceae bacterium]|nr:DUF58 domain-containing protein [Planctomycetaceae bacterium]
MKRFFTKCHTYICREGVYYSFVILGVLFASLLRQVNAMLLFSSLLVCPLFIAWWLSRRTIRKLKIRRKIPSHVHAGDTFVSQIELTNPRSKISSWGVIAEDHIEVVDSGTGKKQPLHQPAVYFDFVKPNDGKRKSYIGRLPDRGKYRFLPMTLSTRFPCGFFRSTVTEGETAEMYVLPRIGKLAAHWLTRQHDANETVLRKRYRPSRVTGEFLGVRGWQHGDAKRWIHWRASARHDQLVVRQYERHQNRDAAILLDLFQPGMTTPIVEENVELAVSFAATLASEIIRRGGCNLTFGTFQEKIELYGGPSAAPLLEQILERLAVLKIMKEDRLAELLFETLTVSDPNADLILVTHQPLNFNESKRFHVFKNDPRLRVIAQRVRLVDTSDSGFDQIFETNS